MTSKPAPDSQSGGARLKTAIHVARARAGITSDMQLALRSGVHYDTFMNWFGDRTTPRPAELKKVADALGISYGDLMAAYEGRDPEPVPLQDAIRDLVDEMRLSRVQQHEATMALLQAVGAVTGPAPVPGGTPDGTEHATHGGTPRASRS